MFLSNSDNTIRVSEDAILSLALCQRIAGPEMVDEMDVLTSILSFVEPVKRHGLFDKNPLGD